MAAAHPDAYENQIKNANDKQFAVEQGKIPYFYSDAKLDTVSAKDFIKHTDSILARGAATADALLKRVVVVLKGEAQEWHESLVIRKKAPTTYDEFRALFIVRYEVDLQSFEATTDMGKLKQTKGQSVNQFLQKCTITINNVYKTFILPNSDHRKLDDLVNPTQAQLALHEIQNAKLQEVIKETNNEIYDAIVEQTIKQWFINGLFPEIRIKLVLKKELTLDETVKLAFDIEKVNKSYADKPAAAVAPVEEEQEVQAVYQNRQNQQARGGQQQTSNYRGDRYNPNYRANSNNGYNSNWRNNSQNNQQRNNNGYGNNGNNGNNRNGGQQQNSQQGGNQNQRYGSNAQKSIVCWFCGLQGHIQTKCTKRIKSNKPLKNKYNQVYTINGQAIIPENGITPEMVNQCHIDLIQGYNPDQDFQ